MVADMEGMDEHVKIVFHQLRRIKEEITRIFFSPEFMEVLIQLTNSSKKGEAYSGIQTSTDSS